MKWFIKLFIGFILLLTGCTKISDLDLLATKEVVVCKSAEHLAFPSVTKLSTGDVICVFRRGRGHVAPDGNILLTRSHNDGHRWSQPDTIISTRFDCRDPSVIELSDGSIFINFFQTKYDSAGKIIGAIGVFTSRSLDDGQTWYTPKIVPLEDYEWAATSSKAIELKSGKLLVPIYAARQGEKAAALVAISHNFGRTWDEIHTVAYDSTGVLAFEEPALIELPDGRILCVMRTSGEGHSQYQSYSKDGGRSWSKPVRMNVQGQAAGLFLTKDNILVCAYLDFSPSGTSYCLSYDYGLTWEGETVLHTHLSDRSYADLTEIGPGRLLCVHYAAEKNRSRIYASLFNVSRPAKPSGLRASAKPDTSVSLRWNTVKGTHYYQIYRQALDDSVKDSSSKQELIVETTHNSFIDRNVKSENAYRYRIVAVASHAELVANSGAKSLPAEIIVTVP